MFFGLWNSPATFQIMIDNIFQPEIMEGWLRIYMDNFIITTKHNSHNHNTKVRCILQKLCNHDLYLKPEKCSFFQQEVKYLGVIIGGGKAQMDLVKVKEITEWLTPPTIWEVYSFLRFCNFYHPFIPHFSNVAQPLNDLICKN